ncbi:MAG: peptide-methionine (R)-S-oxide reductase MsrB [Actinomycetia bacterium]|nr:peptide-methionine (R)-S-oxide reductase MsrB [Actinomycetes bacterium]MCP4962670.1 peptide-methionine (R)-S-oxide reductase MsrB [Actinomycetes bacterium]
MDHEPSKTFTEAGLRDRLTPEQFRVTQEAGTERAFTGCYWDTTTPGTYCCVVCEVELFGSDAKFESGSGWPSFYEAIGSGVVNINVDTDHGMVRTEVTCASCGAHLGHVFADGPPPSGRRYCMNSASLKLDPDINAPKAS